MPYTIEKVSGGFKVFHGKDSFSKNPLTKRMAEKQRISIAISEHKKTGKPTGYYFG